MELCTSAPFPHFVFTERAARPTLPYLERKLDIPRENTISYWHLVVSQRVWIIYSLHPSPGHFSPAQVPTSTLMPHSEISVDNQG